MADGALHTPVLRDEVVRLLQPAGCRVMVDCTVGLGGHAEALLDAAGESATLIGLDVDENNLLQARQRLERFGGRVRLFQANFTEAAEAMCLAEVAAADVLLADLGVSSTQIDTPQRGFSFLADGPLDMRLDMRQNKTAADLVNSLSEKELADVIYSYGEERYSRRIASAIIAARCHGRIQSTLELSQIVARAMPAPVRQQRRGVHPATRTFQALRIAVNDELANLSALLQSFPQLLRKGARAAIISFHSLEDRIVKQAFVKWSAEGAGAILTRKPITSSTEEQLANPRSRSAKLRGIEWNR